MSPVLVLSVYFYYKMGTGQKSITDLKLSPSSQNNKTKIWVSLGLCYSGNIVNFYGKDYYPYKEVIPLTLLLWKYHLPQVQTIVRQG